MGIVMLVTPAGTSTLTVWNTPMYGASTRKLNSSVLLFVENVSGTNWYMSVQLAAASSAPTIRVNDSYLAGSDTGSSRSKTQRRPSSVPVSLVTHCNTQQPALQNSTQTVQAGSAVQCANYPIFLTVKHFGGYSGMDQCDQKNHWKEQQPHSFIHSFFLSLNKKCLLFLM